MPTEVENQLNSVDALLAVQQVYRLDISGIIHVGANIGQEVATYVASKANPVLYIEPIPHVYEQLAEKVATHTGHVALRALCSDTTGSEVAFNISSNQGLSSSILPLGRHAELYPTVHYVKTVTLRTIKLDDLVDEAGYNIDQFNYLNLDVQGAELKVLKGASRVLSAIDAVQTECSLDPLYEGGCTLGDLEVFLGALGFVKELVQINPKGWGEALFLRNTRSPRVARNSAARAMRVSVDRTKPESRFLSKFATKKTSQLGEDGILAAVFERIGSGARSCVELAAGDGRTNSNVFSLWNDGWQAVLIEAGSTNVERLRQTVKDAKGVEILVPESGETLCDLDRMLGRTALPRQYDLLSLDVHGDEWDVWDRHFLYRPRAVCVGFNPSVPNDVYFVQPNNPAVVQGNSLLALVTLARRKGYELAATTAWNAIFVDRREFSSIGISDNSIDAIHAEDPKYVSSFYQLYDGTVGITGNESLIWRRAPIPRETMQVVPSGTRSPFRRVEEVSTIELERLRRPARLFLTPTGGLANRLMGIVSCLRLADLFDRELYIEWPQSYALNCQWSDLFSTDIKEFRARDISHIAKSHRFNRDANVINRKFRVLPQLDLESVTDDIHVNTNCFLGYVNDERGENFWNYSRSVGDVGKYFDRLVPSMAVRTIVSGFVEQHGDLSDTFGVHIRRGTQDSAAAQARFGKLTDANYLRVIDQFVSKGARILLATDSQSTRQYFREEIGARLVTYQPRSLRKSDDAEAIQDALVEFCLLSKCSSVVGIKGSTFAYFASQVRCIPYTEAAATAGDDTVTLTTHFYTDEAGNYQHILKQTTFDS